MDIVAEREKIEWVASQILCVIKTFFRENIDWDQVNGGHLYPIEDVSGFVHMMV